MKRKKDSLGTKTKRGMYVIRKYIFANSALEAIKLETKKPVDDVWLDDESKKQLPSAIGFTVHNDD